MHGHGTLRNGVRKATCYQTYRVEFLRRQRVRNGPIEEYEPQGPSEIVQWESRQRDPIERLGIAFEPHPEHVVGRT